MRCEHDPKKYQASIWIEHALFRVEIICEIISDLALAADSSCPVVDAERYLNYRDPPASSPNRVGSFVNLDRAQRDYFRPI